MKRWGAGCIIVGILLLLAVRYQGLLYTKAYPVWRICKGWHLSEKVSSYVVLEGQDFRIHHSGADDKALNALLSYARKYGRDVFQFFEYQPGYKVDIILIQSRDELHGILGIPRYQSTIGAYAGGKVVLLSPDRQTKGYMSTEMLSNVFVHELTHLVVDDLARGNYPLWFTEGSALYMEYHLLGYEWGGEISNLEPFSLDQLTNRFGELDEYLAYKQSFLLVKGIIDKFGREKYLELLRSLGEGRGFSRAVWDVLGIKSDELIGSMVPKY